jgi:two-component system, NarL family, sensor histidine kinase UhpB
MPGAQTLDAVGAEYRHQLRKAVARDLHDGPIRELTAVVLRLENFRTASDDARMQLAITAVEEHARAALFSLRRMIHDLREEKPPDDVATAIRSMIERYSRSSSLKVELVVSPTWPEVLPEVITLNLLRIVQEAVGNAILHSGGREVLIELKAEGASLRAVVSDDGRGIEDAALRGGGLKGMRERAALIGARLAVRRRHPGTRVQVDLELP